MQHFLFLTEEDDSDVFGKAAVDVLGNKVQGRVVMRQHVLLLDDDERPGLSPQLMSEASSVPIAGNGASGRRSSAPEVSATLTQVSLTIRTEVSGHFSDIIL